MADSITTVRVVQSGRTPATAASRYLRSGQSHNDLIERVVEDLRGVQAGVLIAKLTVAVDGSTGTASVGTVAVESDDTIVGDNLVINVPGFPSFVLAAVALDATVAAAPTTGIWSLETTTDTAQAVSLKDAINNMPGLNAAVSATESSGTVTITADLAGSAGNNITLIKQVGTGTALTLVAMATGVDPGALRGLTVLLGTADLTDGDTFKIGARVFTWRAAPSGENEVLFVNTGATDAAALVVKINAHSDLLGLVSAAAVTATVTITWLGDPLAGKLVELAKTETNATAMVLSTSGTAATTDAGTFAPRTFTLGAT